MKHLLLSTLVTTMVVTPFLSSNTLAATQAECAIWLCLPTGFPSGCSDAKSAMIKRVKKLKSPLPSLSACMSGAGANNSGMSYNYSNAAYVPSRRICSIGIQGDCFEWSNSWTSPYYVKNATCREVFSGRYMMEPKGCSKTVKYIEVFSEGKSIGKPYYF